MILQAFLYYRTYRSTRYLPRDMSLLLLEIFLTVALIIPSLVHSIFTGRTKASHVTATTTLSVLFTFGSGSLGRVYSCKISNSL